MLQFIFYKTIVTSCIGGAVGLVFLAAAGLGKKWVSSSLKYYVFLIPLMLMIISALIWLGVFLLLIYKTVMHIRFRRVLKHITIPKNIKLKMLHAAGTPFITGIFRPTVYIPNIEMTDYEFCMVLKHELTHIKRYDLLYKWFADLFAKRDGEAASGYHSGKGCGSPQKNVY